MSYVVVNNASQTEHFIRLPFATECEDNVCVADLSVELSTDLTADNRYIIGSTPTIPFHIDMNNRGEPAYQTIVRVSTGILRLANVLPECRESPSANGNFEVTCDIDNPFRTNVRPLAVHSR